MLADDEVAEDIKKRCPLFHAPHARHFVNTALRAVASMTGLFRKLNLWPEGVDASEWADDYTVANILITGQIALGLYKKRGKDYVNIPWQKLDPDDYVSVENVQAPHSDVDGSPNFLWLESVVPQFLLDSLYVPAITCFYSSFRRLGTADGSLGGKFDDVLNDSKLNTWETVLKTAGITSKRDWVLNFYKNSYTWDGTPLWPAQMTDFTGTYFKNDEWDDELEHAIAFHLIGTHRLETGSWTFNNVGGVETLTLPFRVPLNTFSGLQVRDGMGRYGVDLYFNEDGLPVLLETPDKELVMRGEKRWQYWKFVWRSSLVTGITLVDHLHVTHYRVSNILSRATRVSLSADTPLRRYFSIITFGAIFINFQAMHVLLGPNQLLHRSTPFKKFTHLSKLVPELSDDPMSYPAVKPLMHDDAWEKLHPMLKTLAFYADGRLIAAIIKRMVTKLVDQAWPHYCSANGTFHDEMKHFTQQFYILLSSAHYTNFPEAMNKVVEGVAQGDYSAYNCHDFRSIVIERFAIYTFFVTAWHRHVGFVGDYYQDPGMATMSWKDGEAFGRPKQHMIMSVINVFTSTRQPLLKEDYTHIFKGMKPDLEVPFTKIWHEFQEELLDAEKEIDRRNAKRKVFNINMSPKVLESAVSK
eukprot:TRINITY_DN32614_c0_g1_i1.p1 TRINITY_DN32614_c0_g1~~TRINITY_DN32614_c0_g1_i1.p1  ORF type:complete len:679 (-),score=149.98 TRINITY_DN32614_c0_g1_i1:77-1996(-)